MKLCKDCKYGHNTERTANAVCLHPSSIKYVSPVTGVGLPILCVDHREKKRLFGVDRCGPEAKYFEPRE